MLGSAKIVAGLTLLSRVTGLIRDMVLNAVFGQNWVQDAFVYGFAIPNLFRRLFGEGALAAVFVPTFSKALEDDGKESAWQLLGRVFSLLVVVLVVLAVVLELAVLGFDLLWSDDPSLHLTLRLTAVMLPFMIGVCLLALLASMLNCVGHFAGPAFAPVILNVCQVVGLVWIAPMLSDRPVDHAYVVAVCVVVASVLQLLFLWPVCRRAGVRMRWDLTLGDPRLRKIVRTMLPVSLASGALLISAWMDNQICLVFTASAESGSTFDWLGSSIAYPLAEGALSAVNNARRLHQFPLGVLAISLATAAFPMFSRFAARRQYDQLAGAISHAMRIALFEAIPVGVLMIILAEPIVQLMFERGRFTHDDTVRVARVLVFFGFGMWAFAMQHIVLRGFYSLGDQLTPLRIGAGLVVVNLALNLVLIWVPWLRESAFALSTSVTASIAVLIGLWLLRRRLSASLGLRGVMLGVVRVGAASALAGAVAYGVDQWLVGSAGQALGKTSLTFARGLGPLAAGAVVYLVAAWLLRVPELRELLGKQGRAEG